MAATSVGPALMNVARAAEGGALRSRTSPSPRRMICAVVRSRSKQQAQLHQQLGGGRFLLPPTSRRRFLQGTGTAVGGSMWGMMSSSSSGAPQARAAGVSEAEEVLRNVQWPEQFPFSKDDFARYDE